MDLKKIKKLIWNNISKTIGFSYILIITISLLNLIGTEYNIHGIHTFKDIATTLFIVYTIFISGCFIGIEDKRNG